jgi:hypothetical protein
LLRVQARRREQVEAARDEEKTRRREQVETVRLHEFDADGAVADLG